MSTDTASARRTAGRSEALAPVVFPAVPTTEQDQLSTYAMERGYRRGHTLGYAAGLEQARKDAAVRRAELEAEHTALLAGITAHADAQSALMTAAAAALAAATAPVLAEAEQTLVDCALSLAEAILGRELEDGETRSRAVLARVLASREAGPAPLLRLNPADLTAVIGALPSADGVEAVADPSLAPGDALADYPDGFLDARISSALDRARRALLETPS